MRKIYPWMIKSLIALGFVLGWLNLMEIFFLLSYADKYSTETIIILLVGTIGTFCNSVGIIGVLFSVKKLEIPLTGKLTAVWTLRWKFGKVLLNCLTLGLAITIAWSLWHLIQAWAWILQDPTLQVELVTTVLAIFCALPTFRMSEKHQVDEC